MADWDTGNPTDNAIVAQYPANERAARAALVSNFGVDHSSTNDANVGKHKVVRLLEQSAQTATAGEGKLYAKDTSGQSELFWVSDTGSPIQLTSGTGLNATVLTGALPALDGSALTGVVAASVSGVTASAAELNILDGATLSTAELNVLDGITASTAELNILDGVTLTASQINDAARKSANNTFTGVNTFQGSAPGLRLVETDQSANEGKWATTVNSKTFVLRALSDDEGTSDNFLTATRGTGINITSLALAADAITLNGVNVTDYARLSQINSFTASGGGTGSALRVVAGSPFVNWYETDGGADEKNWDVGVVGETFRMRSLTDADGSATSFFVATRGTGVTIASVELAATAINLTGAVTAGNTLTVSTGGVAVTGNSTIAGTLGSLTGITSSGTASFANVTASGTLGVTGNATVGGTLGVAGATTLSSTLAVTGAVTAATIANSTSTTLAAGQVHAIDGNATLPNMTAGQWVTVINNGSSARTVTKNASDTMYWTATGSSVTSVTIPARGSATFICADGTNVYASGTISGAS